MPSRLPHSLVLTALLVACGGESTPTAPATPTPAQPAPPAAVPAPVATTPARAETPGDPIAVSVGMTFSCVLRRAGRVVCWGSNNEGQLGLSHMNPVEGPVEVPGIDDAVAIGVGLSSACAVRREGSVVCWGSNRYGELGAGDDDARRGLVTVRGLNDATSVAHASGFCAIRRGGRVSC